MGLEFDLDLLVAELAARGTYRGKFATRGTQVFKSGLKHFFVELPCNSNFKLKISCSTIMQLVTIVHFQSNNNYYHVCYRERIFVIKNVQVICQIN